MDKYFLLHPECYLVEGIRQGAIYNLASGDLISLDEDALAIIRGANEGRTIATLKEDFTPEKVEKLTSALLELQCGNLHEDFFYIEKFREGTLLPEQAVVIVNHLFVEVTRECNLDCIFCKRENARVNRRTGCKRWPGKAAIKLSEYIKTINDAWELGCRSIQFIGGEPFCEWGNGFKHLLEDLSKIGYEEIIINTNGTCLKEEIVDYCAENNIHLIIQVYSDRKNTHDRIAGVEGAFHKVIGNLEKLDSREVRFTILLMITKENLTECDSSMRFFENFSKEVTIDFVFPINGESDIYVPDMIPPGLYQTKETLPRISPQAFFARIKGYHPCLYGKLAVTLDGLVFPCIMLRKNPLADIKKDKGLWELFTRKEHERYWCLDSKHIDRCKFCEYKYACFDCRAVEVSATNDLYAKRFCQYNPDSGEWSSLSRESPF
ncbi:MAG: Coenzyme PQQ synthesis protein E [Syntrophomonadaceae bacterium]|nr:Coenzyme PQQ synthesis protein E [Bacillota bacterium]MBT9147664.1 Coenzyme PQQ synthesis protein E [Bacillota bacterium]